MKSAAPRSIAARGISGELALSGACTHAVPPSARTRLKPFAPSSFAPDRYRMRAMSPEIERVATVASGQPHTSISRA